MGDDDRGERSKDAFQRELDELRRMLATSKSDEQSQREETVQMRRELADLAARLRRPLRREDTPGA